MKIKGLFPPKIFSPKVEGKRYFHKIISPLFRFLREGRAILLLNETGWPTDGTINYIEKGLNLSWNPVPTIISRAFHWTLSGPETRASGVSTLCFGESA